MPIQPARAIVKPRVISDDGSAVPLENEIIPLLFEHEKTGGAIAIIGAHGSGKTTALKHLACLLGEVGVTLFDDDQPDPLPFIQWLSVRRLVVYAADLPLAVPHLHVFRLASWTTDDLIEYLLAAHKCASVMKRIGDATGAKMINGNPEVWRIVLDQMAADENILKFGDAMLAYLLTLLNHHELEKQRKFCLATMLRATEVRGRNAGSSPRVRPCPQELPGQTKKVAPGEAYSRVKHIIRHSSVRSVLARDQIVAELHSEEAGKSLAYLLPRDLIRLVAHKISKDDQAISQLWHMSKSTEFQAMAVSILNSAGFPWIPDPQREQAKMPLNLTGAFLEKVDLSGQNLRAAKFSGADLSQAKLDSAVLARADFSDAVLRRASLVHATMEGIVANNANFSRCDLSFAQAPHAHFGGANISDANLQSAGLQSAFLASANLDRAQLMRSDLSKTNLSKASFAQADFSSAKLDGAILSDLCLRGATFTGASFVEADLNHSDLEFMELPGSDFSKANLTGAYLTGTFIPKGNFNGANLKAAGLAEIEWERADLRNADLRGATFHMGSSRSGHVNSTIACEGSRTGFYTDDYYEQSFKAPEQIRKANLRGADLRGANIDGVDFYLVDLRDAVYDLQNVEHLRRCGAILETRV